MVQLHNTKSLTDFLRNSKKHITHLRASGQAQLLTINGEAAVVVQDAESYQALQALAEQARQDERLRQAIKAVKNSEPAEPAEDVFNRLRQKYTAAS
ncbi:MAG: hypothetical protein ACI957_002952 [Verrucomicrobiales bacterium]|jgi:hypothetical protein